MRIPYPGGSGLSPGLAALILQPKMNKNGYRSVLSTRGNSCYTLVTYMKLSGATVVSHDWIFLNLSIIVLDTSRKSIVKNEILAIVSGSNHG